MSQSFKKGLVQRVFRNFLDIVILRLVQIEPTWGYKIIKDVRDRYGITLRHGATYPLLDHLEKTGFLRSKKTEKQGRIRRVYEITSKGIQLLDACSELLEEVRQEQIKWNEAAG